MLHISNPIFNQNIDMLVKEIREHYKKESKKDIWKTVVITNKPEEAVIYDPEYVKWLENKLADFLTQ